MTRRDRSSGLRRAAATLGAALLFASSASARAHGDGASALEEAFHVWNGDLLVTVPLGLSAVLYVLGLRSWGRASLRRALPPFRPLAFAAGWLALVVALVSPVDALGGVLFSAHMVQHELLMLVAAPLVVLGRPATVSLFALPRPWRGRVGRAFRSPPLLTSFRALTDPLAAWILHGLAIWIWHLPSLYQATLRSEPIHLAQHASFFGTALLFWWAVLEGRRSRVGQGLSIVYVFTTAVHSSVLGALLTFSPQLVYPIYADTSRVFGLEPLEDQQLGGLFMWVPGGAAYLLAGLALFAAWLSAAERSVRRADLARDVTRPSA